MMSKRNLLRKQHQVNFGQSPQSTFASSSTPHHQQPSHQNYQNQPSTGHSHHAHQQQQQQQQQRININKFSFKKCTLFVHNEDFSTNDLLINPQIFPLFQIGDVIEIVVPGQHQQHQPPPQHQQSKSSSSTPVDYHHHHHHPQHSSSSSSGDTSPNDASPTSFPSTTTTTDHHHPSPSSSSFIDQQQQQNQQHSQQAPPPLMVRIDTLQPMRGIQHLSLLKNVADLYGLQNRKEVLVRCVPRPEKAHLDHVEISVRDHFISRSDMWRFSQWLHQKSVYTFKSIQWNGYNVQVKELIRRNYSQQYQQNQVKNVSSLLSQGNRVSSGGTGGGGGSAGDGYGGEMRTVPTGVIVHEHTKITFRSKSAILYWLFQMSREMWEYTPVHENGNDGNLYFEKAVNGFVKEIFDKWKALDTNHSLCMIFFSRHYVSSSSCENEEKKRGDNKEKNGENGNGHCISVEDEEELLEEVMKNGDQEFSSIIRTKNGRKYIDIFKVIDWNDTQHLSPQDMIVRLKREFISYPSSIQKISEQNGLTLVNSSARDGNFFEAINLVLKAYDTYYANRDLTRTGQEIVIISPGVGLFDNFYPALGRITTKRLMDHGLSVDLICLTQPPLHSVPIFRYMKTDTISNSFYYYYRSPDWVNISFYMDNTLSRDSSRFVASCKMPMILAQQRTTKQELKLPKLPNIQLSKYKDMKSAFEEYDDAVFSNAPGSSVTNRRKILNDGKKSSNGGSLQRALEYEASHLRVFNPFDIDQSGDFAGPASLQQRHQKNTFHRRRWAHLHPSSSGLRPTQKAEYIKHFLTRINWQSLMEPACMPLTTDYWPVNLLTNEDYDEPITKMIVDKSGNYSDCKKLLRELVLQRIHEGFQVYVSDQDSMRNAPSILQEQVSADHLTLDQTSTSPPNTTSNKNLAVQKPPTNVYLCSANQLHHMQLDGSTGSIVINRHLVKEDKKPKSKSNHNSSVEKSDKFISKNKSMYSYKYLLWNSTVSRFEHRNIQFYSQVAYNWDKLDDLITGSQPEMGNDLHNRSLQFHLIPLTKSNMKYFVSSSMIQTIGSQQPQPPTAINPKFLPSSPCSPSSENCASPGSFDDTVYPSSLSGSDSTNTAEASRREEMYKNRVKAFNKFKETFFNRNFRLAKKSDNVFDIDITTSDNLDQEKPANKFVQLEKIDSTDRYEWFHLHYKPTYHPSEAFCIKIQWLVCSGMLINEYIHTLIRRANRFNFALVQTPIDTDNYIRHVEAAHDIDYGFSKYERKEMTDDIHPFRAFVNIPLQSNCAVTLLKQRLCHSPFNFFSEHVPEKYSTRFLHETGCVILEFGQSNLIWIDNPLHSIQNLQNCTFNRLDLLQRVQTLCASREFRSERRPSVPSPGGEEEKVDDTNNHDDQSVILENDPSSPSCNNDGGAGIIPPDDSQEEESNLVE